VEASSPLLFRRNMRVNKLGLPLLLPAASGAFESVAALPVLAGGRAAAELRAGCAAPGPMPVPGLLAAMPATANGGLPVIVDSPPSYGPETSEAFERALL
jgi:hypothetical protein